MKRIITGFFMLLMILQTQTGCKKFLNVKPLDRLAGNSFFQTKQDVENNLWDIYGLLRDKLGSCPYLAWAGDLRSGMMGPSAEVTNRAYRHMVPMNDLNNVVNATSSQYWWAGTFNVGAFSTWATFYQVVQESNILYYQLGLGKINGLTNEDVKRYQAEAVFLRCMAYFLMIRMYGDVPYYTKPYEQDPLPRMDMVQVANNCLADLDKVKDDLPWTYTDPAFLGVRACRGAAMALMMNLDMWNAGFDKSNAQKYEQQAAELGGEIVASGAYELLPIQNFHEIFKGRTKESLFEIVQNANYGETLAYETFPDMVLHYPYKRPAYNHQYSFCYFRSSFLLKLYPAGQADQRIQYWFDQDMLSDNGNFQFLKFTNIFAISDNQDVNPDNDIIIFRYAGAILLRAEALADLGQDAEAIKMLNIVRARAAATPYSGSGGQDLWNAIFAERAKELMGEGHYYFDLVRTGMVMNPSWDYYPLTQAQFTARAWTWPLSPTVQSNNPNIQLNTYWLK